MKKWLVALGVLVLAGAWAAPLELRVNLLVGDKPLTDGLSSNAAGNQYQVDLLRFYVGQVALVKNDGTEVGLSGLNLAEYKRGNSSQDVLIFKADAPAGDYAGIRFVVGVPREQNHMDAAKQQAPLGVGGGMYWSWNAGYMFYRLEGKFMNQGKPTPFLMHLGTDAFAQHVDLSDLMRNSIKISVGKDTAVVRVSLDINKMFSAGVGGEPYNLASDRYRIVQGGPVSAQAYLNLQGAWSMVK